MIHHVKAAYRNDVTPPKSAGVGLTLRARTTSVNVRSLAATISCTPVVLITCNSCSFTANSCIHR